jgi:hypothetical protein
LLSRFPLPTFIFWNSKEQYSPSKSGTMLFTLSFALALAGSVSAEGCTRETLIAARDKFFAAGAAKSAPQLAAGAKIALNNKIVPLASTPFETLTGFTSLSVQAVDAETCQIATFRVSSSQVLSTRLRTDASGAITEVEFLQAIQGDQFFRPTGFPSTTPPMWSTKQTAGKVPDIPASFTPLGGTPGKDVNRATCKTGKAGESRVLTRKELVYVASSYCDGLRGDPWGQCVIGHGTSCPRNENGVTTTNNCAVGAGNFGFLTRGRRFVADTETGVVLGIFYFDYGGKGPAKGSTTSEYLGIEPPGTVAGGSKLFLHEYFKVEAGGLAAIYAPMKNIAGAQAAAKTFEDPPAA